MNESIPTDEEFYTAWQKPHRENGVGIAETFQEIQDFAYRSFEVMDKDGDGFVSRDELNHFLSSNATSLRAKSFIRFMLYRLDDIKNSFVEHVNPNKDGVSRGDIREYFDKLQFNG